MKIESGGEEDSRRRQASVYDAVAGRAGYEGFLTEEAPSRYRDTTTNSKIAVPADEVLFRRKGAPLRFEEDDIYAADRHLRPHQRLPDSDLLKAIHAYASDLYSRTSADEAQHDFKSLDETALLAIGILLEEAAAESLGKTGDLALVEESLDRRAGSFGFPSVIDRQANNGMRCRSVLDRTKVVRKSARSRSSKRQSSEGSKTTRSRLNR